MISLESLLRVPYVDPNNGFALSPDGAKAAFAWNLSGQWEIYELRLDGLSVPRVITGGPGGKFCPKYAPDGRQLAYTVDFDGSESFHLFIYDFANNQHIDLTSGITYGLQPNFAWSPDGHEIAFLSDLSGCFSAYIMPAVGGELRKVFDTGYPAENISWSPDGRWLAVTAETHGQDHGVFIVPTAGDGVRQISEANAPLNAHFACWSPDSARLAFSSDSMGYYDIGVYKIASGQVEWITAGDGDKEQPAWSPDGKQIAYVQSRGAVTRLMVQNPGEAPMAYQAELGVHTTPQFTPDGQCLVFIFDNPGHPQDLWSLDLGRGTFHQLTHSLPPELENAAFAMPEEICYPSLDGQNVPALLYGRAKAPHPEPAVVCIHGGPNWLCQMTWNPTIAHWTSRGWLVLAPNYRGSIGYGRAWQLANRFDLGGGDTDDVAAGAMYLVREGLADPARVAITGRSHGGYLTMTCLTRYPELWSTGSAVVPFLNWFASHANAREDIQHWNIENFGIPEENRELWRARSPIFFLDQVRVPVQLICGGHDSRCPASEAIEARDLLLKLGKEVDFALYPDEGHSFLKVENILDADLRRVSFLARGLDKD